MVKLKQLHVHLLPVGAVESSNLEETARHLTDIFPSCRCTNVQEGIAFSRAAYPSRYQYNCTSIFTARVNEPTHKLAHTPSFSHCPNPRCVMQSSDNIEMIKIKDGTFCQSSSSALKLFPNN